MSPTSSPASNFFRYYLPVLLWAAVITVLSRSEFHAGFTYRLVRVVARFFYPDISSAALHEINAVIRKLAHVTEYFLLAALLWRGLRRGATALWRWSWALTTLAAGLLFASLDELHQLFERGRSGSPRDVGFDSLGILLALLVVYTRARIRRARQSASKDSAFRNYLPPAV